MSKINSVRPITQVPPATVVPPTGDTARTYTLAEVQALMNTLQAPQAPVTVQTPPTVQAPAKSAKKSAAKSIKKSAETADSKGEKQPNKWHTWEHASKHFHMPEMLAKTKSGAFVGYSDPDIGGIGNVVITGITWQAISVPLEKFKDLAELVNAVLPLISE